jgi:hypothetical protein
VIIELTIRVTSHSKSSSPFLRDELSFYRVRLQFFGGTKMPLRQLRHMPEYSALLYILLRAPKSFTPVPPLANGP